MSDRSIYGKQLFLNKEKQEFDTEKKVQEQQNRQENVNTLQTENLQGTMQKVDNDALNNIDNLPENIVLTAEEFDKKLKQSGETETIAEKKEENLNRVETALTVPLVSKTINKQSLHSGNNRMQAKLADDTKILEKSNEIEAQKEDRARKILEKQPEVLRENYTALLALMREIKASCQRETSNDNSELMNNVIKQVTDFDEYINSDKINMGNRDEFMTKFLIMSDAVSLYYEKNKGFKWSEKGRRRRDLTGNILERLRDWMGEMPSSPKLEEKAGLSDSLISDKYSKTLSVLGTNPDAAVDLLIENPNIEQINILLDKPVSVLETYSPEKLSLLKHMQGRNKAGLLLNNKRAEGKKDSKEMEDVKTSIRILENMLSDKNDFNFEGDMDKIQGAYAAAIASAKNYLKEKNPKTREGIQRKALVAENLERLTEESKLIDMAASLMMVKAEKSDMVTSPKDLFILAGLYQSKDDVIKKSEENDVASAYALTYDDFLALMGTYNRGDVSFSDGKMKITGNSAIAQTDTYKTLSVLMGKEDEAPTVANHQMKERFYEICRERLDENDKNDKEMLSTIRQLLDLNTGATTSLPLERKTIAKILQGVNVNGSRYRKINDAEININDTSDKTIELKQLKELATDSLYFLNGKKVAAWENAAEISKPSDETKAAEIKSSAKSKINSTLKAASKLGIKGTSLSTHQIDNIVNVNLMAFVDKRLIALERVYKYASNITGKKDIDIAKYINRQTDMNTKLSALVLLGMAAENEEQRNLRQVELDACIKEIAFSFVEEGDKGIYQAAGQMNVYMLSDNGSEGLEETVNNLLYETPAFKGTVNMTKVKKGTKLLKNLCDNLNELSKLQDMALEEGLSVKNANRMKKLGETIQNSFSHGKEELMDFVAKELKGTRFFEGFVQIQSLLATGYSFTDAAGRFADKLTNPNLNEKQTKKKGKNTKTYTQDEKIALLNEEERAIVSVLRMEDVASTLTLDNPQESISFIKELKNTLRGIPKGKTCYRELKLKNVSAKLVQKEDNSLYVILGGHAIAIEKTADRIANAIEEDMLIHASDIYGEEFVENTLKDLEVSGENQGTLIRGRNLCIKYLSGKLKKPETFFANLSSMTVKEMALDILRNEMTPKGAISFINKIETRLHINGEETKELLSNIDNLTGFFGGDYSNVTMPDNYGEKRKEGELGVSEWEPEQKQVVDFISDLIFAKETWFEDYKSGEKPGVRMKNIIESNIDGIATLISRPDILYDILSDLPIEDTEQKNEIHQKITDMLLSDESFFSKFRGMDASVIKMMLKVAINIPSEDMLEEFAGLEKTMDSMAEEFANNVQTEIAQNSNEIFSGEVLEDNEVLLDPEEKGISKEEKEKRIEKSTQKLTRILENSMKGSEGPGLFMKNVLNNYFTGVSTLDKRTMLASAIRNSKPKMARPIPPVLPENATEEEKTVYANQLERYNNQIASIERKEKGDFLGGFLKGAGPLLQKELQGIPEISIPEELRFAIKDMKSNLAPIPEKIVKAQMQNIVDRSGGNITSIKVDRALGAASVGQTFLCTLFGPKMGKKGKEVVVKLLRPDVRNRMMREKKIMLYCARLTDGTVNIDGRPIDKDGNIIDFRQKGGMEATYEGKLLRIEEELDLTIEAKNAQKGALYDRGFTTVKAMKVDNSVEPTTNCLVLEKASGTTVDSYIEEINNLQKEMFDKYFETDEQGNYSATKVMPQNSTEFVKDRERLREFAATLRKRQGYLANLSEKWVTEGIYGQGFYHGDLHAGNIMIDDKGVTLIDFGNATKLTPYQIKHIAKMMMGAAAGKVSIFEESFRALMENTSQEVYDSKKEQLLTMLNEVFSLGDFNAAGQRIMVALIKAQTLGLELPSAIFNFSQSEIRLQNTLDNINGQIEKIEKTLKAMDGCMFNNIKYGMDPFLRVVAQSTDYDKLIENIDKEIKTLDENAGIEEISKDLDELNSKDFNEKYMNGLTQPEVKMFGELEQYLNSMKEARKNGTEDAEGEEMVPILLSGLETLYSMENYEDFEIKIKGYIGEKSPEGCQKALDMMTELKQKTLNFDMCKAYYHYRDLKLNNKTDKLAAAKEEFFKQRKLFMSKNLMEDAGSILGSFGVYLLNYGNESKREMMDALMKSWYEAEDLDSDVKANIKAAFLEFTKAMLDDNTSIEDLNKKRGEFVLAMKPAYLQRLKQTKEMINPPVDEGTPKTFVGIMGKVIKTNLRKSINMLGKWNAIKLSSELEIE